jgi:hypothetical protein
MEIIEILTDQDASQIEYFYNHTREYYKINWPPKYYFSQLLYYKKQIHVL